VKEAYLGRHGLQNRERTAPPVAGAGKPASLLTLRGISAGYDSSSVLHEIDLEIGAGEVVALLGRNGVGKTTTLRTIMGTLTARRGTIIFDGQDITRFTTHRINQSGIAIAPEGRRIFPNLSVIENLSLGQREGGWSIEEIYELFPKLRMRQNAKGENLSGGERQMLAIGRVLAAPQKLILLDEPFEGLAPSVVAEVLSALEKLRKRTSILPVEHKVDLVLDLADRAYVMVNGEILYAGASHALHGDVELQDRLLGVG
jgi:branched-chain amino acid transport system ATP-binding protein